MNNQLFVYGTLLHDIQSMIANHLRTHSRLLGEGQVQGHLYDLGRYPGLVYDPHSKSLVQGQVFLMEEPENILHTLDEYEGIANDYLVKSEYRRELIPVMLRHKETHCWCYLFAGDAENHHLIESGDYLSYIKNNPRHQGFIDSV